MNVSHKASYKQIILNKVSRDCCVALPHGATSLSAVCDCGIS